MASSTCSDGGHDIAVLLLEPGTNRKVVLTGSMLEEIDDLVRAGFRPSNVVCIKCLRQLSATIGAQELVAARMRRRMGG